MRLLKLLLFLGLATTLLIVSCSENNSPTGVDDKDVDDKEDEQTNQVEKVIDSSGGSLSSSNDSLLVTIPNGAIDNETNLSIKNLSPSEIKSELGDIKAEFETVYDISFDEELLKEVKLEFKLNETDGNREEGSSKIHFWSDELQGWVNPIQEYDSGRRKLKTYTNQFSIWGIFKFKPWEPNQVITWSITEYPNDASQSDINSINEILAYSFDIWEEKTRRAGITFKQKSNDKDAYITIEFGEIPGFSKYLDLIGIENDKTTLGSTVKRTYKKAVKIILNHEYKFLYIDEVYEKVGKVIALHEIGHALYLDHTCDGCDTESIMTTPRNAPIAQLYPDDIEQVRQVYNIDVSEPSLNTVEPSSITSNSATSGGIINNDGNSDITQKGVCWSSEENPSLDDSCTEEGAGDEDFSSSLTELNGETNYYVRAYAVNEVGIAYGNQHNFTTEQQAEVPSVNTSPISSITDNSAQSGGNVTNNGGASVTERGVCWSSSQNPTINDSCTSDGGGLGEFTSNITGLSQNAEYFVRAYATNEVGTGYGEDKNFITELKETKVVDVYNAETGRTWMDRNLGASRVAISMNDSEAYGDLYQWGRGTDGHQKRNSETTTTLSSSDTPNHGKFILGEEWRSPRNNNLWQGTNGINNPCPNGYRIPTIAEWEEELQSWTSKNRNGAFESTLKLPVAGGRSYSPGNFSSVNSSGYYWSAKVNGHSNSEYYSIETLAFYRTNAIITTYAAGNGMSVRCIKD